MASLTLLTTLSSQDTDSVLSLVSDPYAGHVFGGSQLGVIHVWSLHTFFAITRLVGHQSSVLSLSISHARSLLFSSSRDNTVRVWDSKQFGNSLYLIKPPIDTCGDVLSLAWCDRLDFLYLGCQDASIQWISLPPLKPSSANVTLQSAGDNVRVLISPLSCDVTPTPGSKLSPASQPPVSVSEPSSPLLTHLNRPALHPHHKFFDSLSQAELLKAARRRDSSHRSSESPQLLSLSLSQQSSSSHCSNNVSFQQQQHVVYEDGIEVIYVQDRDCVTYAHFGYVYCLMIIPLNGTPHLVSGSGDSTIKIWPINIQTGSLTLPAKLLTTPTQTTTTPTPDLGAVLAITVQGSTLYSGYQDGLIKIWDLDTFTCIRTLFHRGMASSVPSTADDVLTLTVLDNGDMFSGCAAGVIVKWDPSFERAMKWTAHQGSTLASCYTFHNGKRLLLTGGSDNCIKVWDVYPEDQQNDDQQQHRSLPSSATTTITTSKSSPIAFQGRMLRYLSQFVSYRSVSNDLHREDCRQAALYLKKTLTRLGADARLLAGDQGRNPLVLATFKGKSTTQAAGAFHNSTSAAIPTTEKRRRRVLYYGHYDVVQSGDAKDWDTPPFVMTGQNGWLYGRGVSDNKGPTLAVACAVTALAEQKAMDVDLVMLIEGEEEAGSAGFQKAVLDNKELIGDVDVILVSNSYWLGDDAPCMTFGLRGVVHATVTVTSLQPDLHSGMQGGAVHEPVLDLVRILSLLINESGKICLDGFYDGVRPMESEEEKLYDAIIEHLNTAESATLLENSHFTDTRAHLLAKWRQPTLSIHKVDVTGPAHSTVIPSSAQAAVSIRIVPDQSLQEISSSLISFLKVAFSKLKSSNSLDVTINHTADWWLGDLSGPYVQAISNSIKAEWGAEPLWIREGGSIPGIPFLEHEFKVKAIHLPMGAASDSAHLPNERIKMVNLEKGKNVVARFLTAVSKI